MTRRSRSNALLAAGAVYLLAYPVWFLVEGTASAGPVEPRAGLAWVALLLGPLSLGTAGCLELARRCSPVPEDTTLDRVRRWVGSTAFGISYPAATAFAVEPFVERAEPFGGVLLVELLLAACGLVLVLTGLVLAAIGLAAHVASRRPSVIHEIVVDDPGH